MRIPWPILRVEPDQRISLAKVGAFALWRLPEGNRSAMRCMESNQQRMLIQRRRMWAAMAAGLSSFACPRDQVPARDTLVFAGIEHQARQTGRECGSRLRAGEQGLDRIDDTFS